MIINLRGTNGSGKSFAVSSILRSYRGRRDDYLSSPFVYRVDLERPLYILGKYETACGGCDTIKTVKEVISAASLLASLGDVLFEGILISTTYGAVGEWSKQYGDEFVFAFMDTPLDVCINRVIARRATAQNFKPFNDSGLKAKHRAIGNVCSRAYREGATIKIIHHDDPVSDLLGLLL